MACDVFDSHRWEGLYNLYIVTIGFGWQDGFDTSEFSQRLWIGEPLLGVIDIIVDTVSYIVSMNIFIHR